MNAQPKGVRAKSGKVGLQRRATPVARERNPTRHVNRNVFHARLAKTRKRPTPTRPHVSSPAGDDTCVPGSRDKMKVERQAEPAGPAGPAPPWHAISVELPEILWNLREL